MKKSVFLMIGILTLATVKANEVKTIFNKTYHESVHFVERGVEFHIFLNGDFDFDTNYQRYGMNRVYIKRDYRGKVRRVGNTFINYDIYGKVKRIGSVYMQYRYGQLVRVGNLRIDYDRGGYPHFYGSVKYNDYCEDEYYDRDSGFEIRFNIGHIFDYDDAYFYRRNFKNKYRRYKEDSDFYYYRALPNAGVDKKYSIIKRRRNKFSKSKTHRGEGVRVSPSRRASVHIR